MFSSPVRSATGSTVSVSCRIAVTRTCTPAGTSRSDRIPIFSMDKHFAGRRKVGHGGADFADHSLNPVTTLLRRARTTSDTSVAVITANGSANPMAVLQ